MAAASKFVCMKPKTVQITRNVIPISFGHLGVNVVGGDPRVQIETGETSRIVASASVAHVTVITVIGGTIRVVTIHAVAAI
jgi:hypothetical protein